MKETYYKQALSLLFKRTYSSKDIVEKLMEDHPDVFCKIVTQYFPENNTVKPTPVIGKAVQQQLPLSSSSKIKYAVVHGKKYPYYTESEMTFIKRLFETQMYQAKDIADLVNKRFHNGELIRSSGGIVIKLKDMGVLQSFKDVRKVLSKTASPTATPTNVRKLIRYTKNHDLYLEELVKSGYKIDTIVSKYNEMFPNDRRTKAGISARVRTFTVTL